MLIDEKMDTGKLIGQKSLTLQSGITTPELTTELIQLSARMLSEYVPKYLANVVTPRQQPHPERATYSRKLTKADGILDFSKAATQLEREVRAFIEWPKSRTTVAGQDVVITKATIDKRIGKAQVGKVYKTNNKKIAIHCKTDIFVIEELKPAGKK